MTKIVLLTGFLGAGKTTFLNNILKEYKENKIGVIINEYSETGIDGELILNKDFKVTELTNGSIFCACIKDKFIDSLISMDLYNFEYIFIEASGLADPSNIGSIIAELNKMHAIEYKYLGAICIVDAVDFMDYLDLLPAIERQVKYSNAVIINKEDLSTEDKIYKIKSSINNINCNVSIYVTSYGRAKIKEIINEFNNSMVTPEETTNSETVRTKCVTIRTSESISKRDLDLLVKQLCCYAYRIKGFCITDEGIIEVSTVRNFISIKNSNISKNETELVVISSIGIRIISEIINLVKKYYKLPVTIN